MSSHHTSSLPKTESLTDHDAVREDEEGDVGSEGAEHQPPCHHHTAEYGNGTSTEIHHTNAADRTWRGGGGERGGEEMDEDKVLLTLTVVL